MPPSVNLTTQVDERRYSFEEFLRVFEDQHAEWLPTGEVEVRPMGTSAFHVALIQWLVVVFETYLNLTTKGQVFSESFIQRLSPDLPAREPDVMVVLPQNAQRVKTTHLDGAADLVVEVVSQESVERDYGAKFREYEQGGVREYWVIDPDRRIVDVHVLSEDDRYIRQQPDADGRVWSVVLPRLGFTSDLLWQTPKPDTLNTLKWVAELVGVNLRNLL